MHGGEPSIKFYPCLVDVCGLVGDRIGISHLQTSHEGQQLAEVFLEELNADLVDPGPVSVTRLTS